MYKTFNLELEELIKGYLAYLNKCDISKIELHYYDTDINVRKFIFIKGEYNVKS